MNSRTGLGLRIARERRTANGARLTTCWVPWSFPRQHTGHRRLLSPRHRRSCRIPCRNRCSGTTAHRGKLDSDLQGAKQFAGHYTHLRTTQGLRRAALRAPACSRRTARHTSIADCGKSPDAPSAKNAAWMGNCRGGVQAGLTDNAGLVRGNEPPGSWAFDGVLAVHLDVHGPRKVERARPAR
jgi:hypothetical protein